MTRTYTFYKDSHPGIKIAVLYITETLFEKTGRIEILDKDLSPVDIDIAYEYQNNIKGVELILEDRVMPSNRMFFAEYCKEHGLNPYSIDDRLTLSHGRTLSDDYYIETEIIDNKTEEQLV